MLIVTIPIKRKRENSFGLRHVQRMKSKANYIFKFSSIRIDKLFFLLQGDIEVCPEDLSIFDDNVNTQVISISYFGSEQ